MYVYELNGPFTHTDIWPFFVQVLDNFAKNQWKVERRSEPHLSTGTIFEFDVLIFEKKEHYDELVRQIKEVRNMP